MLEKSEIRFLPLGARRVAYEIRGDGPPLVAPAWWVSHLELDWQSAGFRRFWQGVADGYALIRYDRLGVGIAWTAVIVAEMIAVKSGLGYVLWDAYYVGRMDICVATMFSVGLLGFVSDQAILLAARLLLRWRTLEAHA